MERLIQYLDDVEDLFYAIALVMERLRRVLRTAVLIASSIVFQVLGILLALSRPPMALAVVTIVMVTMLYRAVVSKPPTPGGT